MKKTGRFFILLFILLGVTNPVLLAHAGEAITLSQGQAIYVPCYSHIYAGNRELKVLLTVTISIRNVDPKQSISIVSVDYYGTKGELLKKYLKQAVVLAPFESTRYVIPQKDTSGGSGANFLVAWKSEKPANPPITESIMIGAEGQLGISFTSRGQVLTSAD